MKITNGMRKETRIQETKPGIGIGSGSEPLGMGESAINTVIPAHLCFKVMHIMFLVFNLKRTIFYSTVILSPCRFVHDCSKAGNHLVNIFHSLKACTF